MKQLLAEQILQDMLAELKKQAAFAIDDPDTYNGFYPIIASESNIELFTKALKELDETIRKV